MRNLLFVLLIVDFFSNSLKLPFVIISIFLLLSSCLVTKNIPQSNKLLQSQIDSLQQMGAYWETIGPWNDDDLEQIDSMLEAFPDMLEKVLLNPEVSQFRLDTLAFFNTQSNDGRIASFTWEEKMGGTYRPFFTLLRYRDKNDSLIMDYLESEIYVNEIIPIKRQQGDTLYVLYGHGNGCTTCIFSEFYLFKITEGGMEAIFDYFCEYRSYLGDGLLYDAEKEVLTVDYYDFDCAEEAGGPVDSCKIEGQFIFNGETFVEKE